MSSILILFLKNEYNSKKIKLESERLVLEQHEQASKNRSILDTYKIIWKILYIKPIRILIVLMVTYRVAFSTESVIRIKLVDEGFAREKLSLLGVVITPILTLFPLFLTRLLKSSKPLNRFRIFIGLK